MIEGVHAIAPISCGNQPQKEWMRKHHTLPHVPQTFVAMNTHTI
jgi:hypothetical protein